MAEGAVRLAPEDSSSAAEVAIHLLAAASSSSSPSLTVLAPASWLSRVPYFATKLTEPWCQVSPSSQQQIIALECTSGSSPAAYLRCFRLLDGGHPRMLANVAEILELLPVADHLLFQECWDACMESLAGLPWSCEEEDAIRATLAVLNLKPSCDVCERLDTDQDLASLETMLRLMVPVPAMEGPLYAVSQECLQVSSAPIKEVFRSLMLKMQVSYACQSQMQVSYACQSQVLPREWFVLTKLLLQFTDAHEVVDQLIDSQKIFSSFLLHGAMKMADKLTDSIYVINEVFKKVVSGVVPLSNSRRALLLTRSSLAASAFKDPNFAAMRQRLAETLPLSNSVRIDLVKGNQELCFEWFHHLLHRIDHWDAQQVEALCNGIRGNNGKSA